MLKDFFENYIYPVATLSGGIIGVGFLALPYVALQVGLARMLVYFLLCVAVMVIVHVIFGEICLRTPDFKRFPGFVGFYFGKPAEVLSFLLMIIGTYGTLLAYLIIGSQFLITLLDGREVLWTGSIAMANLFLPARQTGVAAFFLVFGPALFSLWGTGTIPIAEEMVKDDKKSLRNLIIIGTVIPAFLYILFTVIVLAIAGKETTPSALVGWSVVLGLITTCIAFVIQGGILHQTFMYDLGLGKALALGAAFLPPLILFMLGVTQFIPVISFVGTILLPVNALLILLMYLKVKSFKF